METEFGTGIATGADGTAVADEATAAAASSLGTDRVDFANVFCSPAFEYEAVLAAVRERVGPDASVVGCSSTAEFTDDGVVEEGVAVSLVASDTVEFHTNVATGLSESVHGTVREALAGIPDRVDGYPFRSATVLHDGLAGVGERLALVTQRKLGPRVQFAGGAAADDLRLEETHVFHDDSAFEDAIVFVVFDTQERSVVAVDHGHEPVSAPMEVTAADGNVIHELNGRPAYHAWQDAVREPAREMLGLDIDDLDPGSPEHTRVTGMFEFGIDQGSDYKIRWPRAGDIDPGTGELHFAVEVPEGTVMRVMRGTVDDQIESARDAASEAHDLADGEYAGAFVYDCACRGIILEDDFDTAVEAIGDELDAPFAGFETYGELCMEMGEMSGFHNTTTVIQLLPR